MNAAGVAVGPSHAWMARMSLAAAAIGIGLIALAQGAQSGGVTAAGSGEGVAASYGDLPLAFEENLGQSDSRVDFIARAPGQTAFLSARGATLSLQPPGSDEGAVIRLNLTGADPSAAHAGLGQLPGEVNVLRGNNESKWVTAAPTYGQVAYRGVYSGVDVVWHGAQSGRLEYDFVVAPGGEPSQIGLRIAGARDVAVGNAGALRIRSAAGTLVQRPPVAYQEIDGEREPVAAHYAVDGRTVGLSLGAYDHEHPLVIDPVLVYSTFVGGGGLDNGLDVAVNDAGSAYVSGTTLSTDFPATPGAFDTTASGNDAFVAKINPSGSALDWATYLGPQGAAYAVEPDADGNVYVGGFATSTGFPTTPGAFDTTLEAGQDAFVSKLDPTGSSLVYSTFVGAESADGAFALAIDDDGSAYITGFTFSFNFPTTPGAFDTAKAGPGPGGPSGDGRDAFVTKLDPAGASLEYSTFLGGALGEDGHGIVIDEATDAAYVTGRTFSSGFPTTPGAHDTSWNSGSDAFAARVAPSGASLDYSTFLGGASNDQANAIDIDSDGNAYLGGGTSSADFPPTPGAFDSALGGSRDAFVASLDASGGLGYSTFLGGSSTEDGVSGLVVDALGRASVAGDTESSDFPTVDAYDPSHNGGRDAFVGTLSADGSALAQATLFGGTAFDFGEGLAADPGGNLYLIGRTASSDLPTTPGAFDRTHNGPFIPSGGDTFVAKLGAGTAPVDSDGDGLFDDVDADPQNPSDGFDDGAGTSGAVVDRGGLTVSIEDAADPDGVRVVVGAGTGQARLSVCGFTINVAPGSELVVTCGSVRVDVIAGEAEIVLDDGATTVTVPAGVSVRVTENEDGSFQVENLGGGDLTVTVDGVEATVSAGETTSVQAWDFIGFTSPVDNPPVENVLSAGKSVPLKWRILDSEGAPVTDLATAHMTASSRSCDLGTTTDLIEETSPGAGGLQNLGNGFYQLSWRTPKGYAKSCKTLHLDIGDGVTHDAFFRFTK